MGWTNVLYAKVARRVHQDGKFRALSRNGRLVWLTLLTSEHATTLPGFYRASQAMILDELGDFTPDEWQAARTELEASGMARFDDIERIVWLPNASNVAYNTPDNPNVARSWARKLAQFNRHGLAVEYCRRLIEVSEMWPRAVREAFLGQITACGWDIKTLETVSDFRETLSKQFQTLSSATATVLPNSDPLRVREGIAGQADKSAEPSKPKKRRPTQLAYAMGQAIDELRRSTRIVLPDKLEPKHVGILVAVVNLTRTPQNLGRLVTWLETAEKHREVIGLEELRAHCGTWLAAASKADGEPFYKELA